MPISNVLMNNNLISGDKVCDIFDEIYCDILDLKISKNSDFMKLLWNRYSSTSNSLNGKIFEGLLATILFREHIFPLYVQARLAFIPNVEFDFVLYSKEIGPIVLSAKTSLRERYKQADLEGMMLRQVHRKAETYLITMDPITKQVNQKINEGQILGINQAINVFSSDFDDLIERLQNFEYYKPKAIEIITGQRVVYK